MIRTFDEINEKIKTCDVAVFTAEEVVAMAKELGEKEAYKKVDVVTCATFSPMCSSGAFLNFGHTDPRIRMVEITLNQVPASGGLAAVDTYIGATQGSLDRPMEYGGAHVIEELIAGKKVNLHATSYGTDCYPQKETRNEITLDSINQAYLYNPRNAYQNYPAVTNASKHTIHTYMGTLLPDFGNVTYATSGELSPLLKDPYLRTIGVGTNIFLGGTQGHVAWEGTQHCSSVIKHKNGIEPTGATLAVMGDMKQMNSRYIRAAVFEKYGISMYVGLGIPIPVLDEDLFHDLCRPNEELITSFYDYSTGELDRPLLGHFTHAELRSGSVEVNGRKVPTSSMTSMVISREIANILKNTIKQGRFFLQKPIKELPKDNIFKSLAKEDK
jgi:uncharacterized protein (DUF39 family)